MTTQEHKRDLQILFRELRKLWDENSFCDASWKRVKELGKELSTGDWPALPPPAETGAVIKASGLAAEAGYFKDVFLVRRGGIDPWLIISPEIPGRAFLADREIREWAPAKVVEV